MVDLGKIAADAGSSPSAANHYFHVRIGGGADYMEVGGNVRCDELP
jgi:hypothetical protein